MKKIAVFIILPSIAALLILVFSELSAICQDNSRGSPPPAQYTNEAYLFLADQNLQYRRVKDIRPPLDFDRIALKDDWSAWLRDMPLFTQGTPVRDYEGRAFVPPAAAAAVTAVEVLGAACQCADMAILLRSYFKYFKEDHAAIKYKSVSGQSMSWPSWLKGYRYKLSSDGRKLIIYQSGNKTEKTLVAFMKYLRFVFTYAGSASLARELPKTESLKLKPGDMYIQASPSGGIGHVSIVFDVCDNQKGKRLYLIGYGYIPAMSLFIVKPGTGEGQGDWFSEQGFKDHIRHFGKGEWRSWP